MIQKPTHLASENAETFQDKSVVQAYRHRPPYPVEVFDILAGLIHEEPQHVLDVGCGTGNIARNFVERVSWLDAIDISQQMIEYGKQLPNGNHPRLRWLQARIEDAELHPPYALVTAGESLHWMDWNIVLPRFQQVLTNEGHLAIVQHNTVPDPWSILSEIIPRYRMNASYQPYDMIEALEQHGLFQKVGERMTDPVPFVQSLDDYIESYHSRSGFSRERMGSAQATAFDQEAKNILLKSHSDGMITFQVTVRIVWGFPQAAKKETEIVPI